MSEYQTENNFLIAEGTKGEIYFFVTSKKSNPQKPYIVYDGFDHAIFIRNDEQKIYIQKYDNKSVHLYTPYGEWQAKVFKRYHGIPEKYKIIIK